MLICLSHCYGELRIPMGRGSSIMGYTVATFRFHCYFHTTEMCGGADDETLRGAVWEHCRTSREQLRWREGRYVPRMFSKNIVILHLFSGERRSDDLQSFLSELRVKVIILDIRYQEISLWLRIRRSGSTLLDRAV